MGKSQGGDDAQHGARKGRQALLRPAGDQVHDDARQDGDRQEGYGRGWESVQHQRNEQLPDGETAEDEAEERLRTRPAAEDAKEKTERAEEDEAPTHAPMIAGDQNVPFTNLARNDDQGRLADFELLVELHLGAQFVRGIVDGAVRKADLETLGAELDETVKSNAGVIGLDDFGTHGPTAILGELSGSRQGPESEATECQNRNQ